MPILRTLHSRSRARTLLLLVHGSFLRLVPTLLPQNRSGDCRANYYLALPTRLHEWPHSRNMEPAVPRSLWKCSTSCPKKRAPRPSWARYGQEKPKVVVKMVRTRNWKYVTDLSSNSLSTSDNSTAHSGDELYDLQNDPWELTNVAHNSQNVGVISSMRGLLVDWMLETEDYNPVPLPTVVGRGSSPDIDTSR